MLREVGGTLADPAKHECVRVLKRKIRRNR